RAELVALAGEDVIDELYQAHAIETFRGCDRVGLIQLIDDIFTGKRGEFGTRGFALFEASDYRCRYFIEFENAGAWDQVQEFAPGAIKRMKFTEPISHCPTSG